MAKKTVKKGKSVTNSAKKSAKKSAVRAAKPQKKAVSPKPAKKPTKARPPKGPVWQWSALQTAAAIRSGAISSVEVVEAHIARMRDVNPKLNAVVVDLSEEALKAAKAADNALARRKEPGPLHGVPITIKENVDYEGRPNPNGVPAQMNIIAPSDAPVVRNLKKAGAIVLGLTNTPAFLFRGFTDNPLHGLTLNPWNADITCGGSSGGAGSAVAAGIGTIAHGNDIGGSLRWPAHCNGVVTIKPTQGRVPAFNESAAAERPMLAHLMSAQGPLARSVGDVRAALEVMSQRDPRNPAAGARACRRAQTERPDQGGAGKPPDDMDVDPSLRDALRQAADHPERSGYRVSEIEVPDINARLADLVRHHYQRDRERRQEAAMLKVTSPDFHAAWGGIKAKANTLDLLGWMRATAARNGTYPGLAIVLRGVPLLRLRRRR